MASSMSVFALRKLPGRDRAVLERDRLGDGIRERMREGEERGVLDRGIVVTVGALLKDESGRPLGSSCRKGSVDRVPDRGRERMDVWLCTLERRECAPTGFRWMRWDAEPLEENEFVRESRLRMTACAGITRSAGSFSHSNCEKSGNGERRPSGRYIDSSNGLKLRRRRMGMGSSIIPSSPSRPSNRLKSVGPPILGLDWDLRGRVTV